MRVSLLFLALLLAAPPARALGKLDLDLELDAYYTALGLTIPFQKGAEARDVEEAEIHTYGEMLRHAFIPRFALVELSVNPLPLASVGVRRHLPRLYDNLALSPTLNLVEAVTAGFEEPYAGALFLGKVIEFEKSSKSLSRGHQRKGFAGYLLSAGNYHILESQLIPDNWLEAEWKVKGDQATEKRKMSWSFRLGSKLHNNRDIKDTYYVGLRRSRVDYKRTPYSWLLSSAVEYRADFDRGRFKAIRHFLLVEKNFPLTKRKWTFSLGAGMLWQSGEKYSGDLAGRRQAAGTQILLRPNLKF